MPFTHHCCSTKITEYFLESKNICAKQTAKIWTSEYYNRATILLFVFLKTLKPTSEKKAVSHKSDSDWLRTESLKNVCN